MISPDFRKIDFAQVGSSRLVDGPSEDDRRRFGFSPASRGATPGRRRDDLRSPIRSLQRSRITPVRTPRTPNSALELSVEELDLSQYLRPTADDVEDDNGAAAANHEALMQAVERVQDAAQQYCEHAVQCQALSLWLVFCIWRNDVKCSKQQEEEFRLSVAANDATMAAENQAVQLAQLLQNTAEERDNLAIQIHMLEAEAKEKQEATEAYKADIVQKLGTSEARITELEASLRKAEEDLATGLHNAAIERQALEKECKEERDESAAKATATAVAVEKAARAAFETQRHLEEQLEASMAREEALCKEVETLTKGVESGKKERDQLVGQSKLERALSDESIKKLESEVGAMAAQVQSLSSMVNHQVDLLSAEEARSRHNNVRVGLKRVAFALRSAIYGDTLVAVHEWQHKLIAARYAHAKETEIALLRGLQEQQKLAFADVAYAKAARHSSYMKPCFASWVVGVEVGKKRKDGQKAVQKVALRTAYRALGIWGIHRWREGALESSKAKVVVEAGQLAKKISMLTDHSREVFEEMQIKQRGFEAEIHSLEASSAESRGALSRCEAEKEMDAIEAGARQQELQNEIELLQEASEMLKQEMKTAVEALTLENAEIREEAEQAAAAEAEAFRVELGETVREMEARIEAEQTAQAQEAARQTKAHAGELTNAREGWVREKRAMAERHADELFEATKDAHTALARKEAEWGEEHSRILESWRKESLMMKEAHKEEMRHEIEQAREENKAIISQEKEKRQTLTATWEEELLTAEAGHQKKLESIRQVHEAELMALREAHAREISELKASRAVLEEEAAASLSLFQTQVQGLHEEIAALKHENGVLNDDNTALTVMRARSVRKGIDRGFGVMRLALHRFTMRRQVRALREWSKNKHAWDQLALRREYQEDRETHRRAHEARVDEMMAEMRSMSSYSESVQASKAKSDRRGGKFGLKTVVKSKARQILVRCVTRWRAKVTMDVKMRHRKKLESVCAEHATVLARLTTQLGQRQNELERLCVEHLALRETHRTTENLLEQKIEVSQGMYEELQEARAEIVRVTQRGEDEAEKAKRLAFEAFNSQLEDIRHQLASAKAETRDALRENDELYDELQLAHDQLSLCKIRMEQRDSLDQDMRRTVQSLRVHSQALSQPPSISLDVSLQSESPRRHVLDRLADRRLTASTSSPPHRRLTFDQVDTNHDGVITRQEWDVATGAGC